MTKYISLGQATAKEQCDNHAEEPEGHKEHREGGKVWGVLKDHRNDSKCGVAVATTPNLGIMMW